MEQSIVLTWPAAFAIVAACVTVTLGVIKLATMGRTSVTADQVNTRVSDHSTRLHAVESRVTALETNLETAITQQIGDLKGDMRRINDKLDTMVASVLNAVAVLNNRG